jgi:Zn-dependent membrane protease YugP
MNPAIVILPIIAASFGPRLWANRLLRRHDVHDDDLIPADALARRLLDDNGLHLVRVEPTDVGDHYDPMAKAVRIGRSHFDGRSLTATTTVAHEVGHALQDASGYWPFRLHLRLARLARVTGDVGTVLLIGVPVAAMIAQSPMPPLIVGIAAAGMLGTSLAAQLAALPSELNASFGRALPLLRGCLISDQQLRDARRILLACSLTYVSSSLNPLMILWPWVGVPRPRPMPALLADSGPRRRRPLSSAPRSSMSIVASMPVSAGREASRADSAAITPDSDRGHQRKVWTPAPRPARTSVGPTPDWAMLKAIARPAVRGWLRLIGDY